MALKLEYKDYLQHFGKTLCLHEFAASQADAIGLRHDIDHCIDTALEMAYWEAEQGINSTYFILGTAKYRDDPRLLEKCLQIQDFGHEVGIHTNSITQWFESGLDPYKNLEQELARYRDAGIQITGTSAHGDAACYRYNFINYWLFNDFKTPDIAQRESRLNAEGAFEPNPRKRIAYPDQHRLVRDGGEILELWSMNQQSLGLKYEASHLLAEAYYTDSGGSWKRSPDPLREDLRGKRVQVLMHPIHWKAPRKIFFFLSTARSGSKWLTSMLDQASSCDARHEYTLNHYSGDGDQVLAEKMTGIRLHELLADDKRVNQGLEHIRTQVDMQANDYAEANVYLSLVLERLTEKLPDATLVHLERNPADVVRSIMNRGWYDSPHDSAHPKDLESGWDALSPFAKCCSYVRSTNQLLSQKCAHHFDFEPTVTNPEYLKSKLKLLGIAYYPRLAEPLLGEKINANQLDHFPHHSQWDAACRTIFNRYFDQDDGLIEQGIKPAGLVRGILDWLQRGGKHQHPRESEPAAKSTIIFEPETAKQLAQNCYSENAELAVTKPHELRVLVANPAQHAHLLLQGGKWSRLKRKAGWKLRSNGYYTISLHSVLSEDAKVSMFCLYYDKSRNRVFKRALGMLPEGTSDKSFSFAMMGNSRFFNIGLYLPRQDNKIDLLLADISLRFSSY